MLAKLSRRKFWLERSAIILWILGWPDGGRGWKENHFHRSLWPPQSHISLNTVNYPHCSPFHDSTFIYINMLSLFAPFGGEDNIVRSSFFHLITIARQRAQSSSSFCYHNLYVFLGGGREPLLSSLFLLRVSRSVISEKVIS